MADPRVVNLARILVNYSTKIQRGDHVAIYGLPNAEPVKELMLLYQLAIKLLSSSDPNEVVRVTLELLMSRTGASVAGFLHIGEDGELRPDRLG